MILSIFLNEKNTGLSGCRSNTELSKKPDKPDYNPIAMINTMGGPRLLNPDIPMRRQMGVSTNQGP